MRTRIWQLDPDNVYLWRMNSKRLEAELVRDAVLSVAGVLDLTLGGAEIPHTEGQNNLRRSLYFQSAKEKQMPFLELFDASNVTECYRRNESIVPQQALALVNSPLALTQGRVLARKLSEQTDQAAEENRMSEFITAAFEQVLCRRPTSEERIVCEDFLAEQTARLSDRETLTQFESGPGTGCQTSEDSAQRARENLVQVLMNHNDFVTVR